jgi:hypothetical protein
VRFFWSSFFHIPLFGDLTEGFMILEAECYSSSCRGRVVAIVHLPRGGDEWSGEGGGQPS